MNKKVIITFVLFLSIYNIKSQIVSGVAGRYGNFIFTGRELPKGNQEKKLFKNNEPLANLRFPESEDVMIARVKEFYNKNPYYPYTADSLIINYWQWATGFYYIDSLPVVAKQPDILYGLGVVYFDELPENDINAYEYQIKAITEHQTLRIIRPYSKQNYKIQYYNHQLNSNTVIIDWIFKGSFDVLKVNCFKEYVGQQNMNQENMLTYLIKSNDTVMIRIMDTSLVKGLTYKYHIQIVDPIGRINNHSDTVKIINIPINSLPVIFNAKAIGNDQNKSIELIWKLQNKSSVQTIDIFRSIDADNGYEHLATVGANDSFYEDFAIKPVTGYWYKLVINGVFERGLNTSYISGILKKGADIMPIKQLDVSKNENGIKLNWIYNADDSRGFYIYRANGFKGEMEQVSSLILAENNQDVYQFIDTSSVLENGGTFSYCIKTLSNGYVLSNNSDTASIQISSKTDETILNTINYQIEGKSVLLVWTNMAGINNQTLGYYIYKKTNNSEWELLDELNEETNQYLDTKVEFGSVYQYKIEPVLVGNQKGKANLIEVLMESPTVFAPEIILLEQVNKSVKIKIESNEQDDVEEIWIMRAEENHEAQKVGTLKPQETEFTDSSVNIGKTYLYYVVIKTKTNQSNPSTPNKIEIK